MVRRILVLLIFSALAACSDDGSGSDSGSSLEPNNAVPSIKMSCGDNDCIQ